MRAVERLMWIEEDRDKMLGSHNYNSRKWLGDTGASRHFTNRKGEKGLYKLDKPITVSTSNGGLELEFGTDHFVKGIGRVQCCLLYTSPSPRDVEESRMPSSA